MDILRTVLIVLGIALVVGIYLADRLKRRKSKTARHWNDVELDTTSDAADSFSAKDEPLSQEWVGKAVTLSARRNEPLADEHLDGLKGLGRDDADIDEATKTTPSEPVPRRPEQPPEEAIVLSVMAGEGTRISGPLLLKVLQEVGLAHGDMGLFHYHLAGKDEPLFSVANILEPGRFELGEIATLETPGLALFMRLPAAVSGEQALQTLLQKSRQMAAQLSGTLCDEQRRPLGEERIAELEQQARRYTAS